MKKRSLQEAIRDHRGIVYTLHCPDSGVVRYIGCTIYSDVRHRLLGHFARGQNPQSPVSLWVEQLFAEGKRPGWQTHGQYDYSVACSIELDWIRTFSKHLRGVLLNCIGRTDLKNSIAGRILRLQLAAERPLPAGYVPCEIFGIRYVTGLGVVHATSPSNRETIDQSRKPRTARPRTGS